MDYDPEDEKMSNGIDAIKFFKTTMSDAVDNISSNFGQKKPIKKIGYLSNGQPNCVFDPNIAASVSSQKTAAGDY